MIGIKEDDGICIRQIGQDIQGILDGWENIAFKEMNKVQGHHGFGNVEKVV